MAMDRSSPSRDPEASLPDTSAVSDQEAGPYMRQFFIHSAQALVIILAIVAMILVFADTTVFWGNKVNDLTLESLQARQVPYNIRPFTGGFPLPEELYNGDFPPPPSPIPSGFVDEKPINHGFQGLQGRANIKAEDVYQVGRQVPDYCGTQDPYAEYSQKSKPIGPESRFFQATSADIKEAPWAVYIKAKRWGTGTIISDEWVLTSVYTLMGYDPPNHPMDFLASGGEIEVRYGAGHFDDLKVAKVNLCVVHPKYRLPFDDLPPNVYRPHAYNAALCRLKEPIKLDREVVWPICLPGPDANPPDVQNTDDCRMSGWGAQKATFFEDIEPGELNVQKDMKFIQFRTDTEGRDGPTQEIVAATPTPPHWGDTGAAYYCIRDTKLGKREIMFGIMIYAFHDDWKRVGAARLTFVKEWVVEMTGVRGL